jgi:peptide chain release factor 1
MRIRERLEKAEARFLAVEALLAQPETARDTAQLQKLSKELAQLRPIVEGFRKYRKLETEQAELRTNLERGQEDPAMRGLIEEEVVSLDGQIEKINLELENLILEGCEPDAARSVIIEIRAGTGGEEAALFVADLYRMYSQFAAGHGLKTEVMDLSPTGIGGLKEVVFGVTGEHAYSLFKYESGIHRVQRVPKTEASGRVHTSAVTVAVLPEADETEIDIQPNDLKIDVYRASGAGGQHVNKTESAVRITHIPTGFVVACQDERSQHKNKAKAMRVLRAKIYEFQKEKQEAEIAKNRKDQVGSGDRSGKIRTYNYPDQRLTDHRIGLTVHNLPVIMEGKLEEVVKALAEDEKVRKLTNG